MIHSRPRTLVHSNHNKDQNRRCKDTNKFATDDHMPRNDDLRQVQRVLALTTHHHLAREHGGIHRGTLGALAVAEDSETEQDKTRHCGLECSETANENVGT